MGSSAIMQASAALRVAAHCNRSQATRRNATAVSRGTTIGVDFTSHSPRSHARSIVSASSLSHSHDLSSTLRRQQVLFGAVRMLHQSHALLQAQKSTPSQPTQANNSTSATSTSEKTQLAATDASKTEVNEAKPNKTLTERAKELWATAKYLFKFYFNGVKQIWANRTRVKLVQARVANGGAALTREESQLIRTHNADMRKLPLFLFILLILEEALPLVVIWAPSLLPSTCILPNQLSKIRMGDDVKRSEAFQRLRDSANVKKWLPVIEASSKGARLSPAHKSRSDAADIFKMLTSDELTQLAKMFSLSTWGGSAMVRRRVDSHIAYVRQDDALMCVDGGFSHIPQHVDALAKACSERGLRCSGIEYREMFESLHTWLRYTTRNPDTRNLGDQSVALLPLQMYNSSSLQELKSSVEAESARGLIDKTKDVLREVVEEERKVLSRDERAKQETQSPRQ